MQKCFVLDLNKCTGCESCNIACKNENNLPANINWRQVTVFNENRIPDIPVVSYSIACNHCIDAPCMVNCPALAYQKDNETGVVNIDKDKCMGCNYCQWVCPYDAPTYNESLGIMQKCTMCSHRKDYNPACVAVCPTGALKIGDYTRGETDEMEGRPDIWRENIEPALILKPLKQHSYTPRASIRQDEKLLNGFIGRLERKPNSSVSLKTEWPLLMFTICVPLLVAAFTGFTANAYAFSKYLYMILGIACMGISTIHLGQRQRFMRAVLNWRNSWLSKEIVLFSLFYGCSSLYLLFNLEQSILSIIICIIGFATLFSMDRVYHVNSNVSKSKIHSAFTVITGLYIAAVFLYHFYFILIIGAIKLFFYLSRKIVKDSIEDFLWTAARILSGFILPVILLINSPEKFKSMIIILIIIGEVLDRAEFYRDLEFMRPQTMALNELKKMLSG